MKQTFAKSHQGLRQCKILTRQVAKRSQRYRTITQNWKENNKNNTKKILNGIQNYLIAVDEQPPTPNILQQV